jgi:hypothetical protein
MLQEFVASLVFCGEMVRSPLSIAKLSAGTIPYPYGRMVYQLYPEFPVALTSMLEREGNSSSKTFTYPEAPGLAGLKVPWARAVWHNKSKQVRAGKKSRRSQERCFIETIQ